MDDWIGLLRSAQALDSWQFGKVIVILLGEKNKYVNETISKATARLLLSHWTFENNFIYDTLHNIPHHSPLRWQTLQKKNHKFSNHIARWKMKHRVVLREIVRSFVFSIRSSVVGYECVSCSEKCRKKNIHGSLSGKRSRGFAIVIFSAHMLSCWQSWIGPAGFLRQISKERSKFNDFFPIFSYDIHAHTVNEECKRNDPKVNSRRREEKNEKSEEVSSRVSLSIGTSLNV